MLKKGLLITVAWLAIALGALGIFLPLLPTVPFWLLAAACFSRSSPRFHNWLISHPKMGPVIKQYQAGNGIPKRVKVRAIVLIWFSMTFSVLMILKWWAPLLLGTIGIAVTINILRMPTADETENTDNV